MIGYQNFLAALGFDFSGRIESKNNINRNNIVLVGLTATAYKGSGIITTYKCQICDGILKSKEEKNKHIRTLGHNTIEIESSKDDDFLEQDQEADPGYYKKLDIGTKRIHKMFGGVYVPIPQEAHTKSRPSAVIDGPISALVGDNVKLSAINSFDNNTEIDEYKWVISAMGF